MKRRTQTILLLIILACFIYFWDIFGMLSFGLPSSHYYPKSEQRPKSSRSSSDGAEKPLPYGSARKSREILMGKSLLQNSFNESWRQPRWPSKSLEEEEERFNKFKGPKTRATKKRSKKNRSESEDSEEFAQPVTLPVDDTRYLLPITLGNQGPNNQLQSFKFCLALALIHNYTLVLPPFFEHQTDPEALPKQRTFEDTIDWRALQKIVKLVSVRGFRTACGGEVDTIMVGTDYGRKSQTDEDRIELEEYEDQMTKIFANLTELTIPSILHDSSKILKLPGGTPQHFIHIEDYINKYPAAFNSSSRCNAFVHAYGVLGRFGYRHFNPVFSQYFLRAEYIRTVADKFITQYLGSRFLCLHWRFDKEWVDFWCKQYYEHGRFYCPILQSTPIVEVIRRFVMVLQQYQLNVVYYASPIDAKQDEMMKNLQRTLQYFFTRANIIGSAIPGTVWFKNDNYRLSLLEQEICKRSEFFIASELSSWSDMVIEDRQGVSVLRVTDILR
ncbi:uncharacterized protein [Amphiura filiformis]|uniref:uncharacterized protein n=1 Tax=Amphiura filiformis TaxID=82378 RepID=UPI003B20DE1A